MTFRQRSKGGFTLSPNLTYRSRFGNCSDLNWTNFSASSWTLVGVLETMSDIVTPNWKQKMARGEIIFNPMTSSRRESGIVDGGVGAYFDTQNISCVATQTRFEVDHQTNFFSGYLNPLYGTTAQPVPVVSAISDLDIADLVTEVSTRLLSERGRADNNLFESVAEYKKTIAMFRKPTDSLFRWSKSNGSKVMKLTPENAWLAYRYGLKPFIKDVTGIIEGLSKKVGNRRKTSRANGSLQRSTVESSGTTRSPVSLTFNIQKVDSVEVRAMSIDEYAADLISNIGFTGKGLLTLPWELIPYSFVADWFVNVGDFIGALAPAPGYKQLGSCVTVRRSIYNLYSAGSTSIVPASGYRTPPIRGVTGSCYSSLVTKTRSGIGAPGIVLKHDFKLDDAVRLLDALALLKQILERFFRR